MWRFCLGKFALKGTVYVGEIDLSYGHVQYTCTCIAIGLSLVYMQYVSLKPT